MTNSREQQGFPPRRLHIRRDDLKDLAAVGNGGAADIYVEISDSIFITHHEVYVPEALLSEAVREARAELDLDLHRLEHYLTMHPGNESDIVVGSLNILREIIAKAASTEGGKGG